MKYEIDQFSRVESSFLFVTDLILFAGYPLETDSGDFSFDIVVLKVYRR